jgi:hypothetical protein
MGVGSAVSAKLPGYRKVLVIILGGLWLSACAPKSQDLPSVDASDILVQKTSGQSQPFAVDVCVDATPSMEGFAADHQSSYVQFMDDLEGALVSAKRTIRFFKFGRSIRQITRDEFRGARNASFYHEAGIFRDTDIELVLDEKKKNPSAGVAQLPGGMKASAATSRVTIALTDLFQKDQDLNVIVQQIKDGCLAHPDCSVGILAIPSAFDGTVYDAHVPSYHYRSTADQTTLRPFYMLMFGPEKSLLQLAEVLSAKKYIDLKKFLIIGPRIVDSFSVEVTHGRAPSGITFHDKSKAGFDVELNLREGFAKADLPLQVHTLRNASAFGFEPARLELRGFREAKGRNVSADKELVLAEPISGQEDSMKVKLTIHPPGRVGNYAYVGELVVGGIKGFAVPKWVSDLSSADPRSNHDPAKTLNLDLLIERLIDASVQQDHHRPTVARFRILVHRQ